jgi:hypothetical protein
MEFFRRFSVNDELGTLTWDNEVDVAPETLYAEAMRSDLPSWMHTEDDDKTNREMDSGQSPALIR